MAAQEKFRALLVEKREGRIQAQFTELPVAALPPGEVLVRVAYASLNYKDGLAVTGQGKVIRTYPMVPGVDFTGAVVASSSADFAPGDGVVLTGCGAGEEHWGGYAGLARVPADWLTPLPGLFSPQQAAGIGTAGVTAMMCLLSLEAHGIRPETGQVLVTGASGGVGSLAVALLSRLGYTVAASTGRPQLSGYLTSLGAAVVLPRQELAGPPQKPLGSRRWAGAVDTVGGDTLAMLLTMLENEGCVAAVGLAGGPQLNTTVYPFILRGVKLLGINAAAIPAPRRREIWSRLARDLPLDRLDRIIRVQPLSDIFRLSRQILAGELQGRTVLDVTG